jgi:hypothetical protein
MALSLLLAAPSAMAAASNPATVFANLMTAIAAGNTKAAGALLAPTVKWTAGPAQAYPPKFPLSASGIAAVGALLAQEQAAHIALKLVGTPAVSGDTVTFTADLSNPALQTLGVTDVVLDGTATVSGGLVTSVSTTVAPASAAALEKALGTGATATAAQLPKTGGGPLTGIAGALLLLFGALLLRRPRVRILRRDA